MNITMIRSMGGEKAIHQIRVNEMHDIHRLFNDIHLDTVNEKIILAAMLGVYFVQSSMEKRC